MKRRTAFLLMLIMVCQGMSLSLSNLAGSSVEGTEVAGYWQLVKVDEMIPEDQAYSTEVAETYKRYVKEGSGLSFSWGINNSDYEENVVIDGLIAGRFQLPPDRIQIYEPYEFQVSLEVSHTSSVPADLQDEAAARMIFYGSIDAEDATLAARLPITGNTSKSTSMTVVFMPGNELYKELTIEVSLHGISDLGDSMYVEYVYEWVTEEKNEPAKIIDLRGVVLNAVGQPMPWMKLEVFVYYGDEVLDPNKDADLHLEGSSDHQGRYQFTINPPDGTEGPVGIFIKGTLTSLFPYENNALLFQMMDDSDPYTVEREAISVGTWTVVNENHFKENVDVVKHYRLLAFYHLSLGAFSMDEEVMPERLFLFTSNTNTEEQVKRLENYSVLYTAAHEGWFFGGALLGEQDKLLAKPVKIRLQAPKVSQYDPTTNEIFIEPFCSNRDDYSIYVLLHEFGHYVDFATNAIENFRAGRGYGVGDTNHGGYLNNSTSDSYLEGFATAYAALVQQYAGSTTPGIVGGYPLTIPPYYTAYGDNGKHEEFAMATLLFQTNGKYEDIGAYWSVLSVDRLNFHEYYEAIYQDLAGRSGESANWLRNLAISLGLFKMPFGSGVYEQGEPFKDLNANGQYDVGEPFRDLMYAVDEEGKVQFDEPLQELDSTTLNVGKVAPANTTELAPRYTSYQSADSFLYLSGQVPEYVHLRILPEGFPSYTALYKVQGDKVFLPVGSTPMAGKVEVSVPGGGVFYEASLEALQAHKIMAQGAPIPMGQGEIRGEHWPEEPRIVAATGGSMKNDGTISYPNITFQEVKTRAEAMDHTPMEQLRRSWVLGQREGLGPNAPGTPSIDSSTKKGIHKGLLLGALGILGVGILVVVVVVRKGKKPRNNTWEASPSVSRMNPVPEDPLKLPRFCSHCGKPYTTSSASFCRHCGTKRV